MKFIIIARFWSEEWQKNCSKTLARYWRWSFFALNIAQCDFYESGAAVVASNPRLQSLYLEKNLSPQGQRGFEKTKARIDSCQALYKVSSSYFFMVQLFRELQKLVLYSSHWLWIMLKNKPDKNPTGYMQLIKKIAIILPMYEWAAQVITWSMQSKLIWGPK